MTNTSLAISKRIVAPSKIIVFREEKRLNTSAEAIFNQIKEKFKDNKNFIVCYKTGSYLQISEWRKSTAAIFFGAGDCGVWDRELGCKGQMKINEFVKDFGGVAFGFCAGGYYLSSESIFRYGKNEIKRNRLANLFEGTAEGPLFSLGSNNPYNIENAKPVKISFNGEEGLVYHLSGCHFIQTQKNTCLKASISYLDEEIKDKVAAVFSKVGKGVSFLAGFHPEFSFKHADESTYNMHFNNIVQTLKPHGKFREKIWDYFVEIIKNQNRIKQQIY